MLSRRLSFGIVLAAASYVLCQECDPTTASCPAIPGLATSSYFINFSQHSSLPSNWIQANFENVTYGPNGAEFTFAKRYDAPYIWTNFYFLFGHVDVVLQAAPGDGIISSAVLLSDDLDEIDWEFSGNNFGDSNGKVQTNYFGKGIVGNYDRGTQPSLNSPQTLFHTYTFDWSPTALVWSVDGTVIRSLANTNVGGAYQYPQTPMRLHLGLWDGGDADSDPGTVFWAGGYTDLSKAPFTMYVKSVNITTTYPCDSYQYTDLSGSWQSIRCINSTNSSLSTSTSNTSALLESSAMSLTTVVSASSLTVPSSAVLPQLPGSSAIISPGSVSLVSATLSSTEILHSTSSFLLAASSSTPTSTVKEISGYSTTRISIESSPSASSLPGVPFSLPTVPYIVNISSSIPASIVAPAINNETLVMSPTSSLKAASPAAMGHSNQTSESSTVNPSNILMASNSTTASKSIPVTSTTITTTTPIVTAKPVSLPTSTHATAPDTTTASPSTTTHNVFSFTTAPTTPQKLICNQDNCLRNLLDARYSRSASSLCSTYTLTSQAIPTYLGGCVANPSRVSSACSCMMSMATPTSTSASTTQPPLQSSGSHRLLARLHGWQPHFRASFFAWR